MRFIVKPLIAVISLLGMGLGTAYAETAAAGNPDVSVANVSTQDVDALVKKINAQTKELEKQVSDLKAEVKTLKAQQHASEVKASKAQQQATQAQKQATQAQTATSNIQQQHTDFIKLGASPVVTAPYIGVDSQFDASDLIINQPTYNEDVLLLRRSAKMRDQMKKDGMPAPANPLLQISGKLEGQTFASKTFNGRNTSDIDLSGGEFDFVTHMNDWVNGMAALVYDNNASTTGDLNRISNSRVFVDHAFITIGNLNKTSLYTTIGQRNLPYGHYESLMISSPLTSTLFKIRQRAILVGRTPPDRQGFYGNAFVFKGPTEIGGGQNNINNYGADTGILFTSANNVDLDVGMSGIANIADAMGMQITGLSQFGGFANPVNGAAGENLQRRVPGINLHGNLTLFDKWLILGDFNTATSSFASQDVSFNNKGAKPAAVHVEGAYLFNAGSFPSNFALGYDHTWQALAFNVAQQRYIGAFNITFFKDTVASLEFKREINYAAGDTSTGQGAVVTAGGHTQNTATLQFGMYF